MIKNLGWIVATGFVVVFGLLWFVTDRGNKVLQEKHVIKLKRTAPLGEGLKLSNRDMDCLAKTVYFEARSQSVEGQIMVSFVVLNRVKSKRFPDSVCKVMKQGYRPGKRNCHYSFYCDSLSDFPNNNNAWNVAYKIAEWTAKKYYTQEQFYTKSADHYHADYIRPPQWSKKMTLIKQVGNHIFYSSLNGV